MKSLDCSVEALNGEPGLRFGRGRQGLFPDFRLELPGQGGGPEGRQGEGRGR